MVNPVDLMSARIRARSDRFGRNAHQRQGSGKAMTFRTKIGFEVRTISIARSVQVTPQGAARTATGARARVSRAMLKDAD